MDAMTEEGRQDLLLKAQRNSDVVTGEGQSSMSIDNTYNTHDSVSNNTEMARNEAQINAQIKKSKAEGQDQSSRNKGKIRVQDEQPPPIVEDISSFMTPRPGLHSGLIKRETPADIQERARLERSSVDTEIRPAVPAHIQHSKGTRRAPAGHKRQASMPKQTNKNSMYVAATQAMPFKIKPGQELLRKQQRKQSIRGGPVDTSQPNSEQIPDMIHRVDTANQEQ